MAVFLGPGFRRDDGDVQAWLRRALTKWGKSVSLEDKMKPMSATADALHATPSAAASTYYYYGIARAGPE